MLNTGQFILKSEDFQKTVIHVGTGGAKRKVHQSRRYSQCFTPTLTIGSVSVGDLGNRRWSDACGRHADVCVHRELLRRRVPVRRRAMSPACVRV